MKLTQSMVDEILEVGQEALNLIEEKYPIGTEVEVMESLLGGNPVTYFQEAAQGSRFRVTVLVDGNFGAKEVNDGS